jgi:hypothetical protein
VSAQTTCARPWPSTLSDIRSPRNPASIGFSAVVRFGIDEVVTREYSYVGSAAAGSFTSAIVMSLQPVISHTPYERS